MIDREAGYVSSNGQDTRHGRGGDHGSLAQDSDVELIVGVLPCTRQIRSGLARQSCEFEPWPC